MALVTVDEVKVILGSTELSDSTIFTFIDTADALMDKVFEGDTELSDALKREIQRWYAAHLIASALERLPRREKIGDAEIDYIGTFGRQLEATPYGQVVLQLDITGKMGNIGKASASMFAIPNFDEDDKF